MQSLLMKYRKPAENSAHGWKTESIPMGNGFMGANIFSDPECDRIQITENSLQTAVSMGGLNSFAEIYLKTAHKDYSEYERGLLLNDAVAYCRYSCGGINYKREYFASYPDRVFVIHLTASSPRSITAELATEIPYLRDFGDSPNDGGGKTGEVKAFDGRIELGGKMLYYGLDFYGELRVSVSGGSIRKTAATIKIENADEVYILFSLGTSYKLCTDAFMHNDNPAEKVRGEHPKKRVTEYLNNAGNKSFEELLKNHIDDYKALFDRVVFDIKPNEEEVGFTDEILAEYKNGKSNKYLEMLYFQYGRYLLIASSRKGGLPANLQGIWNCYDRPPWTSGYWHNINVQMNYWPAFNTNLCELFEPYSDYFNAFLAVSNEYAKDYIRRFNPECYDENETSEKYGFTIGTGAWPYLITAPEAHSGPGTVGLTSKLFWEYYDFTRDKNILKNITYPALLSASRFLTKTVKNYDGEYLATFSASPEQMNNGKYIAGGSYYQTIGCAFDQQAIYENGKDFIAAAELLNEKNPDTEIQKEQQEHYSPIFVGASGQIKEYREENFYGEIGEYVHRHISNLVALYPGTQITRRTPHWLDCARFTLRERKLFSEQYSDFSGWGMAHRLNAWARTGDGECAYTVLNKLIAHRTYSNLWDFHPGEEIGDPFQIDGNLGATAGIAEMLLQSHDGEIAVLPAACEAWSSGSFKGLSARGGFEISAEWTELCVNTIEILSKKGGRVKIRYPGIERAIAYDFTGKAIEAYSYEDNLLEFDTEIGGRYVVRSIPHHRKIRDVSKLRVDRNTLELTWNPNGETLFNVYRAKNSEPGYTKIASELCSARFKDNFDFSECETITYKVTASDGKYESFGVCKTINHATQLETERYKNIIRSKDKNIII